MTFLIGKLEFDGPFHRPDEIEARPGLFAILCEDDNEYELLEIDQSASLDSCLNSDEYINNLTFYQDNCKGRLCAAVHYTDDLDVKERIELREELLGEIRSEEAVTAPV